MNDLAYTLVAVCQKVEVKGFVAATDGNISVRLPNGNILATPSQLNKGMVTIEDLIEISLDGTYRTGRRNVSTEIDMHLFIYRSRTDINAVVHCHPPYATGFAAANMPLDKKVFPEAVVGFGTVPLAPYATPSTSEVADSLKDYVDRYHAVLLANHGVVTYGNDLWDAYFKMEKVEQIAQTTFVAQGLGGPRELSRDEIEKLKRISMQQYGKKISEDI